MKVEEYQVNKGHKVKHNGRSYVYGDILPSDLIIHQSWLDQRVLIIRKEAKEEKIKMKHKAGGINE